MLFLNDKKYKHKTTIICVSSSVVSFLAQFVSSTSSCKFNEIMYKFSQG